MLANMRIGLACVLVSVVGAVASGSEISAGKSDGSSAVFVGRPAQMAVSPPLRQIPAPPRAKSLAPAEPRAIPLGRIPRAEAARTERKAAAVRDPVVQSGPVPRDMPAPLITFEGPGNLDGVLPPDNNGDVGPEHYVAMVNMHFCVYDKVTGTNLIAPMLMSELFAAAGFPAPASTTDDGDPVVLYDHLADRWFLSQFIVSVTPCHEVIAISQTGDPTGAWYLYDFVMPNTKMNDYPHFGVWPDGYYMTDNQFNTDNSWGGAGVFAFDRAKMLAGDPAATYQYFDLATVDANYGGMLPADLDGPLPPDGAPNYFGMMDDDAWGVSPVDSMYLWKFHVDWDNPANTTFGAGLRPNYTNAVAAFDSAFDNGRNNVPQKGTTQKLDAISDRLMHRVQYRNFGSHESLTACHTVDADGTDHAGIRYYELRRALPGGTEFVVQEQATFAPDGDHRWMGSAAMDMYGNLAVGYSVSGTNTFPSIRYAGRMVTDPTGGLFQGEAELWAGTGSQTHTAARWGDYSMLAVDPADGVTFWYINEYLPTTSSAGWQTRIGSFRLGSPEIGTIVGTVSNTLFGTGISGARVFTTNGFAATAGAGGGFVLNLPTGTHFVAASADGYYTSSVVEVEILLHETNFLDFGLAPIPLRILPKAGYGASGMEGGPFSPASQTYVFSNASLAELTWTSQWTSAWLEVAPQGGSLAAGETVQVALSFGAESAFLAPGTYADTVAFSNATEGRVETRAVALTVTPYSEPISCEGFDAGLPAGWTVVDNTTNAAPWRFDDPGGNGNLTGGEGVFAVVDSDYEGSVDMDTELRTPAMDFTGYASVGCRFKTDFNAYSGTEVADVDVSLHGAAGPWSNLWTTSSDLRGPRTVALDLAAAAGASNVMLRFHYYNANYEWWWQVDDVCFVGAHNPNAGQLEIQPPAGLEASGYYPGPFAPERLYRLTNVSVDDTIGWNASASAPWFEVDPAIGALDAGVETVATVRISADAGDLLPGDYSGEITFQNELEGVETVRSVALTVREPLVVQPLDGFAARGLEGGPFVPDDQAYELTNPSEQAFAWTSLWTAAWLEVEPNHGDLAAHATQTVTVGLADGLLTTPGVYSDAVVFSNLVTHVVSTRAVTVTVVEITGELDVSDTLAPTNDLLIPFGTVEAAAPRTEHVTVMNTDAPGGRNLIVSNVFFGYYREDFSGADAQDWQPDVEADWSVTGGEYRAQSAADGFMASVYAGGQVWGDFSAQVDLHRAAYTGSSAGLAFRTSADLDPDGTGQGYLFLVSGGYYSIWWEDGASYSALQAWTLSTTLKSGATDTNRLLVSAVGSAIRFYVNDTLTWEGSDAHGMGGTIALVAYSLASSPNNAYFDNVRVGAPRTETVGLGRKTRYLNAYPLAGSRPQGLPSVKTPLSLDKTLAPADQDEPRAEGDGPFTLSSLPAFPATLAPGESFTFDVTYAPVAAESNADVVTIWNNDNDEPWVHVDVNGRAAAGALTGRVTAAHSGGPIVGATVVADNGDIQLDTATDTNGTYRLDLLIGEWTVSAMAPNYATGTVSGVEIADLFDTTQDFVLTGSVLTSGPASIEETLNWGQGATNALCLTNSGPFDLDVRLRAYARPAGSAPVSIPPSDGDFPRGSAAPSAGQAPAQDPTASSEPTVQAPARVLCYGIDMDNSQLVSFYSDAPGTFTVVGSSGANLIPCVDFLNGDFSTLYALDYDAQQLVTFDVATAAKTVVGAATPASGQSWVGLAADPDGTLYAASTDGSTSTLYEIDPATGAATTVGAIANAPLIIAIAVNGAGEMYGLDIANDNLIRIDKTTGAGTVVGSVGFDANYAQGMDFDEASDVLYLAAYNNATSAGELRIADVLTGNSSLVGTFQGSAEMNIAVASSGAVPWVSIAPETVNVPAGGSACVDVAFDTTAVPNAATTHLARIAFDGNFVNAPAPVELSLTVVPDDLDVAPADAQTASGQIGGPFSPDQFLYVATNQGAAALDWSATHAAAWLDLGPTNGTLAAGDSAVVTAAVNGVAATLAAGSYTDVVTFVNQSTGVQMPRTVVLEVYDSCAVLISEYVEGTSNNKALEIYNPHSSAIDLAAGQYVVQGYQNGTNRPSYTINLTGTIAAEDAFVLAHSSAGAEILAVANQTSGVLTFNGNDAVVLRMGGTNGTVLDSIGQVGVDPGTEWGTGLTSTADNTLRRKFSVPQGDLTLDDTFDPATEWDGYAKDTLDGLGSHTNECTSPPLPTPPILNPVGNQFVLVGGTLQFQVVATPTDGDAVTLTASNLPAGATFNATNENGTFLWTAAAPTGTYGVTFYATDKDGADEETISIVVAADLPAPVIQPATGVHATRFNANWLPSAGATGYRLDVATNAAFSGGGGAPVTLINENFNSWGTSWTNGWTHNSGVIYPTNGLTNSKCVGMNAAADWIQAPNCTNPATLSFYVRTSSDPGSWTVLVQTSTNGLDWNTRANVVEDGTTTNIIGDTYIQTNVVLNLTGTYQVRWYMFARSTDSCYIDNVLITGVTADTPSFVPGYENRNVGGATTCAVTGLTVGATYYYRAKAYDAVTNSPYSATTNVTTAAGTPPVLNPIGNQSVAEGDTLQFAVSATPTEDDAVTLTASNLPAGATFNATNGNGTFQWLNASPTGGYAATFYATDVDGADEETISIAVEAGIPELPAPVIQAASDVRKNQFNANWLASDGATGYWLDVATNGDFTTGAEPGATLLAEDFQAWDGTTWTNGWTHDGAVQYALGGVTNSRCVGLNSTDDWIQSPPCTNPAVLSFYVRTSSDPGSWMVLVQTSPDGSDWTDRATLVENETGGTINNVPYQTNVVLNMTGICHVRWYMAAQAEDSCYVDNVLITAAPPGSSFVPGYEGRDVDGATTFVVTGLTANTTYHYRAKAYNDDTNSLYSETTNATTIAGTPPVLNPIGDQSVFLGGTLQFEVSATPTESDAVTLTASNLPSGSAFYPTNELGTFLWTAASPTGVYSVTFTAADDDGSDEETISVTVAEPPTPPVLNPIGDQSVFLGGTLQFEVSATPTESDAVTLTASNLPSGSAFYPTNELGTFLWTAASPTGVYSVTFNAADEDGADDETIGIAVHPLPLFDTFTASNGAPASATFLSVSGQEYRLEFTLDLVTEPVAWTLVESANGTGGMLTLSDTNAPDAKRYYRIAAP